MPRMAPRTRRLILIALCVLVVGSTAAGGFWWRRLTPRRPLELGLAAYEHEDWPAAERAAREELKHNRDDTQALLLLARSLHRQNRDESATAIYSRLSLDAMTTEDYYLRGLAFLRAGQGEYAILTWRRGLGTNPNHVETLVALEGVFARKDLLNEAARAATNLSSQPGWKSRAALMLGMIRSEQGDTASAADAFSQALEEPAAWRGVDTIDQVRKRLARLFLQLAKPGLARREIAQFDHPNDPEAAWLLTRCALQEGKKADASGQQQADLYRKAHPIEPEPSPYAGEAACAGCHKTEYTAQHASRHARTYWRKHQFALLPFPEKPFPDPGNQKVTHTFQNHNNELKIQSRAGGEVFTSVVDYAFGSGDRGLTLVGHDDRARYFECRLSYYAEPFGWDVTSGHPMASDLPPDLYQGMLLTQDAVRRCFVCHATSAFAALNQKGPAAADHAIGCERCHGPGANHVQRIAASGGRVPKNVDLAIARPALARGAAIVGLCAGCHSPRDKDLQLEPGSPESARFQATTLTWSRCYTESGDMLSCVTCHNPHKNADKRQEVYERRCLECHGTSNSSAAAVAKGATRLNSARVLANACPVEPAHNCIECHMPKMKTPVAHAQFTDHFIRVHRPSDLADKLTLGSTP
jgi:hypothetical protein